MFHLRRFLFTTQVSGRGSPLKVCKLLQARSSEGSSIIISPIPSKSLSTSKTRCISPGQRFALCLSCWTGILFSPSCNQFDGIRKGHRKLQVFNASDLFSYRQSGNFYKKSQFLRKIF